jgi:hypothetical protein
MRLALIAQLLLLTLAVAKEPAPVRFDPHVIEGNIPGGYSVLVTDINHDGRPDVLGMTQRVPELAWYENPRWERHVMVRGLNNLVNMAAQDIDGDGYPEVAIQSDFSMVAAQSPGLNWLLVRDGDPRGLWKRYKIDQLTTSHHLAWADLDGDGRKELVNAPLIGPNAVAPKYEDHTPLVYYKVPPSWEGPWERRLIDDRLFGIVHRVRPVKWVPGRRDQLLITGFEGILLYSPVSKPSAIQWRKQLLSKGHQEPAPRAGSSDVALGRLKAHRFLAAVEPWHGNEVVVYTPSGRSWRRRVIFDSLIEGHEVCVGDLNGDGREDIVVGDRARGRISTSHIFYAADDRGMSWRHVPLDENGMSASGCAVADINRDGRLDIVMIGGATHNIKWYENLGP